MRTELFDFTLPDSSIALHPVSPRDSARMLIVKPVAGSCALDDAELTDRHVSDLADILKTGDALVFNNTRVIAAALDGTRTRNGVTAGFSINLTERVGPNRWKAFARPAKKLEVGDDVLFTQGDATLTARVAEKGTDGEVEFQFAVAGAALDDAIARVGHTPLPPYIALKRQLTNDDVASYQTIYAEKDGAVAAPTAGLHFTPDLFTKLEKRGISRHFVTLHVGAGTFLPVKADDTNDHVMHSEWGELSADTAAALRETRAKGGRIVAVGTTSMRVLESAARATGGINAWTGDTDIFITPGFTFKAVDLLMTNFHLPRSTLFMLVSAFSGLGTMRAAYGHAIANGYRFYSYGDASLLFPATDSKTSA
jgi:S-adenosylmethionine:tRNA ribosyltransferase-isomerase